MHTATEAVTAYVRAHRNREFVGNTLQVRSKSLVQIAKELNLTESQVSAGLRAGGWHIALEDAERVPKPAADKAAKKDRPTRLQPNFNPHGWSE
jgi:hypothetical protein